MNDHQKKRFVQNIVKTLFNTVSGKKIAIWGFAFKKDTNDTRETAAIYICRDLLEEQAHVSIYDPQVPAAKIYADLGVDPSDERVTISSSAEEAAEDAHAIAVLTEWDEFKGLNYEEIYSSMLKPAFVFDGRNILDGEKLKALGFEFQGIGA